MTDTSGTHLTPTFETEVVGDIVFRQAPAIDGQIEQLRLDVYLPVGDRAPLRPAIIWFHGGGFRPGNDKRQVYIELFASALAARGYVGIAPDYRLRAAPEQDAAGTLRDTLEDARAALDWVRAHSRDYRIDPRRLVLAGGSAGGMLVLNLCHDPARPLDSGRDGVVAIVNLWGTPGGPLRRFAQVSPASPPTLLIHGTADTLVPYALSQGLAEELRQAGVAQTLLSFPDAPHTPLGHKDEIIAAVTRFVSEHAGA